jgi:hypothetical protein
VAGSCEYGDEHAGSAATELVSYNFLTPGMLNYGASWPFGVTYRFQYRLKLN